VSCVSNGTEGLLLLYSLSCHMLYNVFWPGSKLQSGTAGVHIRSRFWKLSASTNNLTSRYLQVEVSDLF
jgi:hypothetical protein